jgi:hypothetical protein
MDPADPDPSTSTSKDRILQSLKEIEQAVWRRRPILEEIVQKRSDKSLYEYTQGFIDINPVPQLEARRPELFAVVQKLLSQRLSARVADEVVEQLKKYPLVSTADHHGPINNPFFVNSNIISGIPYVTGAPGKLKYLVDFSFASISINNSSFPRGIEFNSDIEGTVRIPLFPDKLKMGVAYSMRSYTREELDRALDNVKSKERETHISKQKSDAMQDYMEKYYGDPEVLGAKDFSSQITKLNYLMWPSLFRDGEVPNLIYLEIETIVAELLQQYHFKDTESLIHKFLFDPNYYKLVLRCFEGIDGAFSVDEGRGSYMFWALDDKCRRVALHLKEGRLVSNNGEYDFAYTPEGMAKALENKQVFPGMLLCYLIIALYYGMKCLGGFSQVHDLTLTKEAWMEFLIHLGKRGEVDAVMPMQTKEYGGDGMLLAYLPSEDQVRPAYGIEMGIGEVSQTFGDYIESAKRVNILEAVEPMMPEIYQVLYPQDERIAELSDLTLSDIAKAIGLLEKLRG